MGGLVSYLLGKKGPLTKPAMVGPDGQPQFFNNDQGAMDAGAQALAANPQEPSVSTTQPQVTGVVPDQGPGWVPPDGSQITAPSGDAPPNLQFAGGQMNISDPSEKALPKYADPSFQERTTDAYGNVSKGNSPGLTKLGVFAKVLNGALQGTLDAVGSGALNAERGKSYFGAGVQGAAEMPFMRAARIQAQQKGQLENQQLQNVNSAYNVPIQIPGPNGQPMTVPLGLAGKYQDVAKTGSEINKNTAEASKATAEAGSAPIHDALTKAQIDALPVHTSLEQSQIGETNAKAEQTRQQTVNGPVGPAAEAQYRSILAKAASGQQLSPQEVATAQAFEDSNAKNTTQSDSLGVTSSNTSRPAGLASVLRKGGRAAAPTGGGLPAAPVTGGTPAGSGVVAAAATGAANNPDHVKQNLVDMVGNYNMNPTLLSRLMAKHPDVLAAVHDKYPDWDETNYNAKNAIVTKFTSGDESHEINSINTAMGHLKNLDDAVDALNNHNITALNKIGAYYHINVAGQTPEAAFKLIVHRVGPEISSAYVPGGGGEGERGANAADFDVNLPGQTLHNNASITATMLRSKIGALENQYQHGTGRNDFEQRFITPEARAALQKFSPQAGASSKPAAGGVTFIPLH